MFGPPLLYVKIKHSDNTRNTHTNTSQAFFTTLIGYFLVKVTPLWGLALLSTVVLYLAPLVYIKNKDVIDAHLNNAADIANKQTEQLRQVAAKNTNKAFEATSSATSQYVSMAQEYMGGAKKSAVDKGYISKETAEKAPGAPVEKNYATSSFKLDTTTPSAPAEKPASPVAEKPASPLIDTTTPSAPAEKPASPVAEKPSSPIAAPATSDFPAAPTTEPTSEAHLVGGPEPAPAVPVAVEEHGIEEKKEPLHAL